MLSFSVPVKTRVREALDPLGRVWSKLTLVVCASSSWARAGESEMSFSPEVTLAEWILRSMVLRVMDVESSTTSKLGRSANNAPLSEPQRSDLLDGDGALVGEGFKVGLQGEVVVDGLHVGGEHLAGLGDVHGGGGVVGARVSAHVSAVGAVSNGDGGGMTGSEGPARGRNWGRLAAGGGVQY